MSSCLGDYAVDAQADSSDNAENSLAQTKPPAWNKPSNNVIVEVGPVMGAVSWPALSDSARASPKSSSESLKTLSDGSISIPPQCSVMGSPTKEQLTTNANPNSNQNNALPTSQKSENAMFPVSSPNDPHQKRNNWDEGSRGRSMPQPRHAHVSNHPHQPNSSRKNNYGGRRDQERPFSDWNSHNRGLKGRSFEMQHQQQQKVVTRNFVAPPAFSPQPFPGSSPVGPLANSPVSFQPPFQPIGSFMPFGPPSGYYVTYVDPQMRNKVVKQIEYYFSEENLCKDTYLRQNMDEEGLVSIYLIAGFNKVKQLTNNIPFILDALRFSNVIEIQGDKVRKKNDWMKWLLRPSNHQLGSVSGAQSPGICNTDTLASRVENLGLEEGKTTNSNTMRSFSDTHSDNVLSSTTLPSNK